MNKEEAADKVMAETEVWPDALTGYDDLIIEEYIEPNEGDFQLDVTWFSRAGEEEKRPAVVFLHGGGWKSGDKKQFYRQSAYMAEKYGLFCVNVEYRLSGAAIYPAAIEDSKCAVRWVRSVAEKHNIDTNRIAICGGSAGAHIAAMVATTNGEAALEGAGPYQDFSGDVHLAILFNGHFDMADQLKDHIQDEAMNQFFGGYPWEIPEVYGAASPFLRAKMDTPPMLFLHGDQDHYPHRQSVAMADRLKHYGVHAECEVYEGKGHAWFNKEPDLQITTDRMCKFICEQFGVEH